jgi:predicted deacylase
MRVEQLGIGEPKIAIVGGIHGDEPCGPRAIEALIQANPSVNQPVKLVIVNEKAAARNLRYIEEDLNRVFPGNPEAQTHEGRLAYRLLQEIRGCTVFSLHSTQSYEDAFALCDTVDAVARTVVPYLSVDALVETHGFSEGRLIERRDVIEVECGRQGSDKAAENGLTLCREFLTAMGVLSGERKPEYEIPVFRMGRAVSKEPGDRYEVFAQNFQRVEAGEKFAAADGQLRFAESPFYPILMSPYGYEDVFGYAGELVGRLDAQSARTDR